MDFHTSTWTVWDLELGATRTDCNWEEVVESLRGITNRKTFRNTRGGSNPVWPMELECALVQGLSRHVSLRGEQGRNRSRFISDFILETTNQIRTPKQVSSRLQHLRNSTKTVWVRRLIERRPVSTVSVDQNPTAFINNLPIRLNTEALPPEAQSVPCAGTSLVELPTRLNTEALPPEAQSVPCAGTSLVELERERSHAIEMYNRVLIHSGVGMPSNDEFNSTGFSSQVRKLLVSFLYVLTISSTMHFGSDRLLDGCVQPNRGIRATFNSIQLRIALGIPAGKFVNSSGNGI
ncbi:hypothetical protein C8R45DRAFT_332238 [Mycena sanguinolenta]|nr:hypothetical protein C8R45DRAFT_332238 [Mycena sanguinolenta]